jgi:hypothetical protein
VDEGVRALGIDDWAKKKGHSYGTILVDLEKHRVVEMLWPRGGMRGWLRAGVEAPVARMRRKLVGGRARQVMLPTKSEASYLSYLSGHWLAIQDTREDGS